LTLPSELQLEKTERLRAHQQDAGSANGQPSAPEETVPVAPPPPRRGRSRLARRLVRTILGPKLSARVRAHLLEPRGMAAEALDRVGAVEDQLELRESRRRSIERLMGEMHAATVNQELLKAEIRSVVDAMEELGMAIAPAAGLGGAGARLSELRERVNGLDRRLRALTSPARPVDGQSASPTAAVGGSAADEAATAQSALFDYVGFERRFRGDPAAISAQLADRYLERLAASPPVLDIGCGNAGLVEQLTERGVKAIGVDTDPSMVAEAQARNLDVRLMGGTAFLRDQPSASLGAIIATHLVEHLQLAELVELLELAASRLKPGGVFITETPNPASLIVLGNSYALDPTHVRPLHPSLLTFLCEGAGFRDVRLHFYAPATDYHLPLIDDPDAPPWAGRVNEAFEKLNRVLFGPQDYAIVATAAPGSEEVGQGG
jgi:SAM-dependent methyltransferase